MKYKQSDKLQESIDWENIYAMPRYAGGHDNQMTGLFKNATLIAHWNEGDYQGYVATCVLLNECYIIYNDSYGSCSGCDAWEDANDEQVKNMCVGLSNSAYIFKSLHDVRDFLQNVPSDSNWSWQGSCSSNLLIEINKNYPEDMTILESKKDFFEK